MKDASAPKRYIPFGKIIVIVILIASFAAIITTCNNAVNASRSYRNKQTDQEIAEFNAKYAAIDAVKQKLIAPGSAQFCGYEEMSAINTDGDYWEVTGYVDAQNSFGAYLRKYFTVTLEVIDDGDAYRHGIVTFYDSKQH